MKIFGKKTVPLFLAAATLAGCNSFLSTPTMSPEDMMKTAISTVSTAFAETTPLATSTPLVFTDPSIPLSERIVYYRAVVPEENPTPEGTILAAQLLAPAYSDEPYTSDTEADLRTALEIILHDRNGIWVNSDVNVAVQNAHTDVVLQGEYHVAGGSQLWTASWQILMTVFANPSVQTATVTFNGGTIVNLGISRSENAKPDNYVYTRAEIETYMNENAYVSP